MKNRLQRSLSAALRAFDNNQLFFAKKSLAITLGHQGKAAIADNDAAKILKFLGWFSFYEQCFDEAQDSFHKVLNIELKTLGNQHPGVAHTTYMLAEIYRRQGFHTEAKELYRASLKIIEQSLGKDHYCYKLVFRDFNKLDLSPMPNWHTMAHA